MHTCCSTRRSLSMAVAVVLAAAGASCSSPCETPATFLCCQDSCIGDRPAEPICTSSGWVCAPGQVSSRECPGSGFCQGAPPGLCNGSMTTLSCCEHDCDNDVLRDPSCVNGEWVCPPDYVSSTYCPGPRFCQGPMGLPIDAGTPGNPCDDNPGFTCCVGACTNDVTTSPVCDASGWHCPTGAVSQEDCPGQPFCLGG